MPIIQLELNSKGAIKGLKEYDSAVDKSAKKTTTSFDKIKKSAALMGTAVVAGIGAATTAMIAFSVSSINAASDLEETQGKFDVVFRGLTETAEGWADTLVDSYGLSERASKQYLSSVQDLLVPTGLTRDEAGKMSNEFVKLAVDLGSFNNLPTATVVRDIQSALAGGSETMTKYGIDVKVAAVKAEVLALGLDTSTKAAERQSRTVALLSIMQRDSSDAMGDFARTTASYANQSKILGATLENIRAEVGGKLLPVVTALVTKLNEWLRGTDAINITMLWTVKVVRFVHDGIAGLILVGDAVVAGFAYFFDFMSEGFRVILKPLDLIFDGLVKLGAIDTNPFDVLTTASQLFKESSTEVFKNQLLYIDKSSAAFDKLEKDIMGQGKAHEDSATRVKNSILPAEQALESQIDRVTAAAHRSTSALMAQGNAASAVNGGYADDERVSISEGTGYDPSADYEFDSGTGDWTIVNNFNTQQSKSDIVDITTQQATNEARV